VRILAVDPGKITGYAQISTEWPFESTQLPMLDFLGWAEYVISEPDGPEVVVCESFIVNAQTLRKTRGENWSLEQIGVLRWFCHKAEVPFTLQSAASAKGFVDDDRLKHVGWYHGTTGGHANDAARHLLTFIAKQGKLSELGVSLRST
jgi:hypothetical protein